ncbi:MAG: hypothetical protein MIO93_12340 [ANME-2 cluster archaeon]|jgi:hypothetical protein|nr:hypothetical protein [ANME-2 cluster archaeon]
MKRRIAEILNLKEDSLYHRETKVRWVDRENEKISHGQNKLGFNSTQEPFLPKARRFRYEA